jgi:hypothetical protein
VGAPPQTASLLEEIIVRQTEIRERERCASSSISHFVADPELDDFMV